MSDAVSRRDVIMKALPAVAFAGAMAAGGSVFGAADAGGAGGGGGGVAGMLAGAVKDGKYVLPALAYDYAALEPHIDAETMRLHHDKHHAGYVKGLNGALEQLAALDAASGEVSPALLGGLQEDLSFNAGGHLLHTLFWLTMGPGAGGEPKGDLADALTKSFGSVEAFRSRFAKVAGGVKGSGWAILAHEPVADRLFILQVKQHDLQLVPNAVPLLPLDVWEHAYYLKYHNVRADYVKAWWDVVNWSAVGDALAASRKQG
jgi:Fe-Mn family superoxide dismutase